MAVRVVREGPPHRGRIRLTFGRSFGFALMSLSVILAIPDVWIPVVLVVQHFSKADRPLDRLPEAVRTWLLPSWTFAVLLTIAIRYLGIRLVRKNRHLVLFLRRFGNIEATKTVRDAVLAIGGSWRLITLDDKKVDAVGVNSAAWSLHAALKRWNERARRLYRITTSILRVVALVAGAGVVAAAGMEFLFSSGDPQERFDTVVLSIDGTVAGGPGAWPLRFFVFVLLLCLLTVMAAGPVALVSLALTPVAVLYDNLAQGVEAAEVSKRMTVDNRSEIASARRYVAPLSRRVFAPRLLVVKVANAVWQRAVIGFAVDAAVALIDVSIPSVNVCWEVELLIGVMKHRCILVGQEGRLAYLNSSSVSGSDVERLRKVLDERRVLAYSTDSSGRKRFVKALRASLEYELRHSPGFTTQTFE